MHKIVSISFVMLLFAYSYACADEIFTHDGRRFQGVISEEGKDYYIMRTKEGTIILNKNDVLHLERDTDKEQYVAEKGNFITKAHQYVRQLPKNNWYLLRVNLLRIHTLIFSFLEKNKLYRYFADKRAIQKFRRENYKYYYFVVYMALFITITVCLTIIKNSIMYIFRRLFGVKRRYDM